MKLLVVTQYFWPENFRVNDFVAEMVRRGHDVTVLTGVPNYPEGEITPRFLADPDSFKEYEGARVVRVPMVVRGRGSLQLMCNYLTFAVSACTLGPWRLRGQCFDAIFACQLSPLTSVLPGVLLSWIKRVPLAMWVLDLWPETLTAVGVARCPAVLNLVGRLASFIYRRCDLILAQSRSFVPLIRARSGSHTRIEYFPSWAESIFLAGQASPASEISAVPDTFSVMFAGNIGESQDFAVILAAAELLREQSIRWLIVGDGRLADWVAEEVKQRDLANKVFMLGRHPLQRMPAFFQHADALLVSLRDEPIFAMTIPGKIQTYLASGIPIVAMLNGEGAKVVADSGAGLACPAGDAQHLARAIQALSQMSSAQRAEMGKRGVETYRREFEREKLIDQLEIKLTTLLSSR